MREQPKVSVVMPSLNVQSYIRECIESVCRQTLQNIEIICVDAGSTDGTLEILREYEKRDPRIKLIISDKKSYGYQMNLGLQAATGEYFALVETDDYIEPDMYEKLCAVADQNDLDVVRSDFSIFVGEGSDRTFTYCPVAEDKAAYNRLIDPSQELRVFRSGVSTWNGIYRMRFLRENEICYNETPGASYQDCGFYHQMLCLAHRLMFYPGAFYMLRRDNPNSSVKSKAKVYYLFEEFDFVRKQLQKRDPTLEKKFAPVMALCQYMNYNWNLERIAEEYKPEFLRRFAEKFRAIQAAGDLQQSVFSEEQWENLQALMEDPQLYYYSKVCDRTCVEESSIPIDIRLKLAEQRIAELNGEVAAIRASWSYRIGRAVTCIPRKIRGVTRCCCDHGWRYTMRIVKETLFG